MILCQCVLAQFLPTYPTSAPVVRHTCHPLTGGVTTSGLCLSCPFSPAPLSSLLFVSLSPAFCSLSEWLRVNSVSEALKVAASDPHAFLIGCFPPFTDGQGTVFAGRHQPAGRSRVAVKPGNRQNPPAFTAHLFPRHWLRLSSGVSLPAPSIFCRSCRWRIRVASSGLPPPLPVHFRLVLVRFPPRGGVGTTLVAPLVLPVALSHPFKIPQAVTPSTLPKLFRVPPTVPFLAFPPIFQ